MRQRAKNFWIMLQDCMHNHEQGLHRLHHGCHLVYFALILLHGPYHIAAGGLLVLGALTWALGIEE